jgi:hypothetical protein
MGKHEASDPGIGPIQANIRALGEHGQKLWDALQRPVKGDTKPEGGAHRK